MFFYKTFLLSLTMVAALAIYNLSALSFTNSLSSLISTQTNQLSQLKNPITGWGGINFGMTIDEVKRILNQSHPNLTIKENPFSDIVEEADNSFLEIYPDAEINSLQFQFNNVEELYLIRLRLSNRYFNFTGLLDDLKEKYGLQFILTYEKAIWEDDSNRLELYKNNQITYLDKKLIDVEIQASPLEQQKEINLNKITEDL